MPGKRKVILKIELDEDEYRALEAIARSQGYELPTHMVESMVRAVIRGQARLEQGAPSAGADLEQLARRLRRTIEDLLNPYTAKIDEINRRLGQIIEMLEEQGEAGRATQEQAPAPAPQEPRYSRREHAEARYQPGRRRSAMDRLREDGILVSSEAPWINEPERFFASLERRGAKVFRLGRGLFVAVHPEFWEKFVAVLRETAVRDPAEVETLLESALGEPAVRLFRLLVKESLVYYDEDEAAWRVAE